MIEKVGGEDEVELVGGFELPATQLKLFTSPGTGHSLSYLLLSFLFIHLTIAFSCFEYGLFLIHTC